MTTTRSTGLYTGYMDCYCGNGYKGLTKELDDTVKREAELLAKTFNRDVEIRFNSDRESGGAWLRNSLKGFNGNCQVGLNAGLRAIRPEGMSDDGFFKAWRNLPKELYIETYVSASCLKDPSLAKDGTDDDPKCAVYHKTIEDAIAWLVAMTAHHLILLIVEGFTQIYSIALLTGILVARNLNQSLAIFLTNSTDVKGVENL